MDDARAALHDLVEAFNARDHQRYAARCTDDIEAYAGVGTPLRFEGKAAWTAFVRGLDDLYATVTQEVRHETFRAYGDTVVSNGYFVFTTVTADGMVDTQTGRQTVVLVRSAGDWQVANLHFSAMF